MLMVLLMFVLMATGLRSVGVRHAVVVFVPVVPQLCFVEQKEKHQPGQ